MKIIQEFLDGTHLLRRLKVEVADSIESIQKGLMWKEKLDKDSGMLFIFPDTKQHSLWGRNTLIDLDVAFLDDHMKIIHIDTIKSYDDTLVSSPCPCKYAIETSKGYFNRNRISIGNKAFRDGEDVVFQK